MVRVRCWPAFFLARPIFKIGKETKMKKTLQLVVCIALGALMLWSITSGWLICCGWCNHN